MIVTDFLYLQNSISRFVECPILVVGDLMLDEFIWGRVSRISPEAPVPVVEVERRSVVAGGAANTVMNVLSLGGRATIVGVVGCDSAGERIAEVLSSAGVSTSTVIRDTSRATTTKTRVVAHSQQVVRIDEESNSDLSNELADRLVESVRNALPHVKACVISDYGKGVAAAGIVVRIIAAATSLSIPILVDPKGTNYLKYRGATLVKPNQAEAGKVLNRDLRTDADVNRAGADLIELLGGHTTVLITRGSQGMSLFEPNQPVVHLPAQAKEVYDVTGAGDTVAGTLALAKAVGISWIDACHLASAAAAIVVQKVGSATASAAELDAAIRKMSVPT